MSSSSSHKYVALLALAFQTVSALPSKYHSPNPRSILKRAADGPWFTDFADPGIVQADDGLYAYSTQSGPHIPTAFSTDIAGPWNYLQHNNGNTLDALPTRPSWYPDGCDVYWAPNVFAPVGGGYNMLFAGPGSTSDGSGDACANLKCIGVATSGNPAGPFTSLDSPVIYDDAGVQSFIDGSHFTDVDSRLYYLYSGAGTINIQEVDAQTGTQKIGDPPTVIWTPTDVNPADNDNVTEAPFLIYVDNLYFLFYSTGVYSQPDYTVTYATSQFILGPYTEQGDLLASGATTNGGQTLSGPGGATLIPVNDGSGNYYMAFHAIGNTDPLGRPLYTATVSFAEGKATVL